MVLNKNKIIDEFREICIRNWTSDEYQFPAYTKFLAELKANEVCVFLKSVLDKQDYKECKNDSTN